MSALWMAFFRFLERVFGLHCDLRFVYSIYWVTAKGDSDDESALEGWAVGVDVHVDEPSGAM